MTTREQTIARLERSKAELVGDLRRTADNPRVDRQWREDRIRELAYVNRTLARMGAAPAHISVG